MQLEAVRPGGDGPPLAATLLAVPTRAAVAAAVVRRVSFGGPAPVGATRPVS
ncbi:hypothetical protein UG55_1005239 [Frankia sp. EI5c]|nr:hypothetical protein UG55_1005239 [Frankia sp. EI5c]